MHVRLTIRDSRGGETDAVVDCADDDVVGDVLEVLRHRVGGTGAVTVDGVAPAPGQRVADSGIRDGATVAFGAPAYRPPPDGPDGLVVRVLSGPSAGRTLPLRPGVPVVVGRGGGADLALDDPDVSRPHARLDVAGGEAVVTDLGSTNGTWLAGRRLTGPASLAPGSTVQVGGSRLRVEGTASGRAAVHRGPDGGLTLTQHYLLREGWSAPTVTLPAPVPERRRQPFPLLAVLLPLAAALGLAAALRQPYFLLFALLSPVSVVANQLTDRRGGRREDRERQATYERDLRAALVEIDRAVDDEDARLRASLLPPPATVGIAVEPRIELWQRQPVSGDG